MLWFVLQVFRQRKGSKGVLELLLKGVEAQCPRMKMVVSSKGMTHEGTVLAHESRVFSSVTVLGLVVVNAVGYLFISASAQSLLV